MRKKRILFVLMVVMMLTSMFTTTGFAGGGGGSDSFKVDAKDLDSGETIMVSYNGRTESLQKGDRRFGFCVRLLGEALFNSPLRTATQQKHSMNGESPAGLIRIRQASRLQIMRRTAQKLTGLRYLRLKLIRKISTMERW